MVARISAGKSIKAVIHYNEAKISGGHATLIMSSRFGCDADDLSVAQKTARFQALISRNLKVKTNAVHISLNFAPGERLDLSTVQCLAADYMQRIGFADQPFLVYQHHDASHPHIHIVTTNIRANGRAISLHNIGRLISEPARKALEQIYGLVVAEGRRQQVDLPAVMAPVTYGKTETKRAISNIVREVTSSFQYTSLEELNVALRYYNVTANRGMVGSGCWSRGGLTYSILDRHGGKVGVPIAASAIYGRPVLSELEKKMAANRVTGLYKRRKVARVLEKVLSISNPALAQEVLRRNHITIHDTGTGKPGGDVYLLDHMNRTVISVAVEGFVPEHVREALRASPSTENSVTAPLRITGMQSTELLASAELLRILTTDVFPAGEYLAPELLRKKKKNRKKQ